MSTTNWIMDELRHVYEPRTDPTDNTKYQRRGHSIMRRHRISTAGTTWTTAIGSQSTAAGLTCYFGGAVQELVLGFGAKWECTDNHIADGGNGDKAWFTEYQTWETYGAWASWTPP